MTYSFRNSFIGKINEKILSVKLCPFLRLPVFFFS
jgi:hypothetical protein